jgi:type I restriction enzyme M protein
MNTRQKKSGADVSASALLLERRKTPLKEAAESKDYAFFVGNIESVGWRVGDKKSVPVYRRDERTGALILDDENEPMLDADFEGTLNQFLHSPTADCFPWSAEDREIPKGAQIKGIDIEDVVRNRGLSLDPKRHSGKFIETRNAIQKVSHFRLGDVLEVVPTQRLRIKSDRLYRYVEIERVGIGEYDYVEHRGWQLPSRAKLLAEPGDFFIPHVWGCAGKWFIAAGDCEDLIVTNGCTRLRLKDGQEGILPDLVIGLCSEVFCVQMRALATGSDGLAEIGDADLLSVLLPKLLKPAELAKVTKQIELLLAGEATFAKFAKTVRDEIAEFPSPALRKNHWALV